MTVPTHRASRPSFQYVSGPAAANQFGFVLLGAAASWVLALIYPFPAAGNLRSIAILSIALILYLIVAIRATRSTKDETILINFCLYNILMYIIPGIYHCSRDAFPFFNIQYKSDDIEAAANLALLFCLSFCAAQLLPASATFRHRATVISASRFVAVGALYLGLAIFFGATVGTTYFLTRRAELDAAFVTTSDSTIFVWIARIASFTSFLVAIALVRSRRTPGTLTLFVLAGLAALLFNYPLAIPRTYSFGYTIILIVLFVDFRKPSNKALYSVACVLGLMVAAPALDFITRGDRGLVEFDPFDRYLRSGDFDGLQSTINVVLYVQNAGLSYGQSFLSACFFFVPRSIWPDKSHGTGLEAAMSLHLPFVNISSPIVSEFYVDLGLLGVVIGGLITATLIRRLDCFSHHLRTQSLFAQRLLTSAVAGFIIIISRGSWVGVIGPVALLFTFTGLAPRLAQLRSRL